ncbi:MAG: hypothetical protein HKN05_12095, partial [Rhizobiales bacterium]|nr:hypothetical protein [Hyphomicrobiales bacterium]
GKGANIAEVREKLGVDYVLEGSVRKSSGRVRINAQLINTKTGDHLWAKRFDRKMEDIFALQDEVTRDIVAALTIKLTSKETEALKSSRSIDPTAYDLFLRGLQSFQRFTPERNREARDYFRQALEIEPEFARALGDMALSYGIDLLFSWSKDRERDAAEARRYGSRALEADATVREVHFALSTVEMAQKQVAKSIDWADRAIIIDSNYADAYAQRAQALAFLGEPEQSYAALAQAMKLNPLFPSYYTWIESLLNFVRGDYEAAIRLSQETATKNPEFTGARLIMAASYGLMDNKEDGSWQVEELLTVLPDQTLKGAVEQFPFVKQKHTERFIRGLRASGLN